jgi:hypothetical protein
MGFGLSGAPYHSRIGKPSRWPEGSLEFTVKPLLSCEEKPQ